MEPISRSDPLAQTSEKEITRLQKGGVVKRRSAAGNVLWILSQMTTKHPYLAVEIQFERRFSSVLE
jgi:hypothetical protein